MKIILILKAPPEAVPADSRRGDASAWRVYTGSSPETAALAERLFILPEPPTCTPLLDEASLQAGPSLPERALARARWFFGSTKQPERRSENLARARELVDVLEREDRDCVLFCGELMNAALKSVLRRRGYCLEGGDLIPRSLERVRAVKQSLHCGGCHHNCLLSEAKCQIGQAKARERGIKRRE